MKVYKFFLLLVLGGGLLVGMHSPSISETAKGGQAIATFAGGCFWCMEGPFDKLDGVVSTTSGYTGGQTVNPTYEEVSAGGTGHAEAVQVVYDPQKISYQELLAVYWPNTDPTTPDAQFCDHGDQYRPEIFYHDDKQRQLAEASKEEIKRTKTFSAPLVTEITQATAFYPAEEYHQDFYRKNPIRYKFYRFTCGRDARLATLWGDEHERHG
jgi:peptide-methionine (S)-S-oxide reductase